MVKEIQKADEYHDPIKKGGLVVVDFSATWCGPCKMVAPLYEELSKKYPDATFLKVDVDDYPDITEAAGVTAMPTFVFYKGGVAVGDVVRGARIKDVEERVVKLL
ncbi:cytosolic thioredoxin Trx1 [Zopfochytrium polystomum]|nr:cytosolic thioredoxin Trx1 [Zopfochytrium polystomum]